MNLPCAVARACPSDTIGRNSILFHSNKLGESWARGRRPRLFRVQVRLALFSERKIDSRVGIVGPGYEILKQFITNTFCMHTFLDRNIYRYQKYIIRRKQVIDESTHLYLLWNDLWININKWIIFNELIFITFSHLWDIIDFIKIDVYKCNI